MARYKAIAVIEFRGSLTRTGESVGHYLCDVQVDNKWFRTNDDCPPIEISSSEVTENGYAFLYQRIN